MRMPYLPNEASTIEFGRQVGAELRPGDIVKITGSLGAGKTTFVRGVVEGMGGNPDEVHSPTFSIVHTYESPIGLINHCDFYRLEPRSELQEFGGLEFFDEEKVFLLEWPERVRLFELITRDRLIHVHLEHDADGRYARLSSTKKIFD